MATFAPFPDSFFWGAATASYQVEGNNQWSDWWFFEQQPNAVADGTTSGAACDFWNRFDEYLDLAQRAGMNALRISLEWARIEPEHNQWSDEALTHYRTIIRAMKARGIEPIVTLWHFSLPQWFAQQNGWLNEHAIIYFSEYVRRVKQALGDDITYWITLNEPMIYTFKGFGEGSWPPGIRMNPVKIWRVRNILAQAHAAAYHIIKHEKNYVGIAANIAWNDPKHWWSWVNHAISRVLTEASDFGFLRLIQADMDYVGLNYYFHNTVKFNAARIARSISSSHKNPDRNSDLGWEIAPEGIYKTMRSIFAAFNKPIMVTENGLADARDTKRPQFIAEHVAYIRKALEHGVPVLGYLHWALMDNVEWALGKTPRFGLIAMDYETMRITPRQSLWEYKKIIEQNKNIPA